MKKVEPQVGQTWSYIGQNRDEKNQLKNISLRLVERTDAGFKYVVVDGMKPNIDILPETQVNSFFLPDLGPDLAGSSELRKKLNKSK